MSASLYRWTTSCDDSGCPGDCDLCNRNIATIRTISTLISAMEAAGWHLDEVSTEDYQLFRHEDGISIIQFYGWCDVEDWLRGVVFDDPEVSEKVDRIFNSDF